MSDSNRGRLSYIKETTFGVTPSGTLIDVRKTSDGLVQETDFVASQEIRSDRQVPDNIRTSFRGSGAIGGEFSYATWEDWSEWSLMSSAWTTLISVSVTGTVDASANTYTRTDAGNFLTDGFLVGEWIESTGNVNAANDGFYQISALTTTVMTLVKKDLLAQASDTFTLKQLRRVANGTTFTSMSLERKYEDLSSKFAIYKGMAIESAQFKASLRSPLQVTWNLRGKGEPSAARPTATAGTGYTVPNTNAIYNSIDNVKDVIEGVVAGSVFWTDFEANWNNNFRLNEYMGALGPQEVGVGRFQANGRMTAYFKDNTIIDKYLQGLTTTFSIRISDSLGTWILDFPNVKMTLGSSPVPGPDQDVFLNLEWVAALSSPANGYSKMMSIHRL